MEEKFGNLETEQATEEKSNMEEYWEQLKEVVLKAAQQTIGYCNR